MDEDGSTSLADFTATFDRAFDTDGDRHYVFRDGDRVTSVWAYGTIESGSVKTHGNDENRRGRFQMSLYYFDGSAVLEVSFIVISLLLFVLSWLAW